MSEERPDVSKELAESVRDAIGRKLKISLKKMVKLEVKADKLENRVLALASHRVYLLTARIPSKVEQAFNYLDIQGIVSHKPDQLTLKHERGQMSLKLTGTEEVDEVVAQIGSNLQRICPGLSPVEAMGKLSLKPEERITALQTHWEEQAPADSGPCGGFSLMYFCICDQRGLPYREEVQWDVDTIYLTQDTRELNLQDFIHLDNRDLVPVIAVLEYNQWFTKLSVKDYKLSADLCEQILRVVACSSRLEELVLENVCLKVDFAQRLASALSENPRSALHTLNVANNSLEDKGVDVLRTSLVKQTALKHLNLSRNSLSPKGINILGQSLSAKTSIFTTLTHLDLSGNSLRGDDLQYLCNFLGQQNNIQTLDLSNCSCPLDLICASLFRGCVKTLSVLNMSKSVFSQRKGKDITPFKQFFNSASSLSSINFSGTRFPMEALKALLLGLASNPNLKEVSLDLSSCELRSAGAQILEGCIAEIPNISSLDISDNGFDTDLTTLLVWLSKNRSIRHLSLGKNFNNIKSKNLVQVLSNLVHMIQEEESPLTSLSLADSKLKGDLSIVLNALGSNTSLTKLDISGNGMGDMGAKMLAKALQINTKLRTVVWDRNNISPQGLQDVAAALEKNYTIRFMPVPIIDAAQALKANPEKTEDALLKMEQCLLRNHETRKYLQEQAYRLQQGIVTTTTQQMIDRMCVKVQDHLNSLRYNKIDAIQADMRLAENLMKDARNSKRLLPTMYYLRTSSHGNTAGEGPHMGPIQDKLESMAGEVTKVMEEQLQNLLQSMVDTAEGLCPNVVKQVNLRQELMRTTSGKMAVPQDFVATTLLEQSGVDIMNKISEVKLSMASFLSDRIVDEILESLSYSQHTLAEHLSRKGQPLLHHDSQETEVLEETIMQPEDQVPVQMETIEDLESCLLTPKSKRKSILVRMTRPVSVAFELEFDLDKALEDVPIHIEDLPPPSPPPPSPPPKQEKKASGFFGELPSVEPSKLQHITRLRPKRSKNIKGKKAPLTTSTAPAPEVDQNGLVGKVDEGVDDFFFKKVIKLSIRTSAPKALALQEVDRKRESRMSGLFNLIKPRSSKSEKNHGAAAISPHITVTTPTREDLTSPVKSPIKSPILPPVAETTKTHPPQPDIGEPAPPEEPVTSEQKANSDAKVDSDHDHNVTPAVHKEEHHTEGKIRNSPLMGRHGRMPVMGNDFLAEIRAKQEKRALRVQEVPPSTPKAPSSEAQGQEDKDTTEKKTLGEARPEPALRTHLPQASSKPLSSASKFPKQTKTDLEPPTSGLLRPRTSSSKSIDHPPEPCSDILSPKVTIPTHPQKVAPSVTELGPEEHEETQTPPSVELTVDSVFEGEAEPSRAVAAKQRLSLRSSAGPTEEETERQRTKSLPAAVGMLAEADTVDFPAPRTHEPDFPPVPEDEAEIYPEPPASPDGMGQTDEETTSQHGE
ncbi:F-actin-uncapping protein LRRC16A-like [Denticeps clupeoides]|uniref:F-actin-uncapping protein LRRC16A-like n=1 Tax=Denticeps clupeoides TaxID=299321 RepID=UPI0010A3CF11|nr:F-actin-uncapping protein LRRC16A-like [Denticeps clupeoides]